MITLSFGIVMLVNSQPNVVASQLMSIIAEQRKFRSNSLQY